MEKFGCIRGSIKKNHLQLFRGWGVSGKEFEFFPQMIDIIYMRVNFQ